MLASVNAVNSIMMALSGQSFKVSNFAAKWKSTSSACIAEREKKRESVTTARSVRPFCIMPTQIIRKYLLFPAFFSRSLRYSVSLTAHSFSAEKMNFLVDFDSNLLHEHLIDSTSSLIQDAESLGIRAFVVPGTNLVDSYEGMNLKLKFPCSNIITTCGIHPYNADKVTFDEASKNTLLDLSKDPRCSAVGECGLDYSEGFPDRSHQLQWFQFQVDLALQYGRPLYFHVRNAEKDFLDVLLSRGFTGDCSSPLVPCVVHCFTGSLEELRRYVDMGFYVGLTGYIFSLSDDDLRTMLEIISLDRLVIETDAPYMGFKGCRSSAAKKKNQKYPNIPSALIQILDRIADVSRWDRDTVIQRTTSNALTILRVDPNSIRL